MPFLFSVLIILIIIILLVFSLYLKGTITLDYSSTDNQIQIKLNLSNRYHQTYQYKTGQNPWDWYRLDKRRRGIYIIPMIFKRMTLDEINWDTVTGGSDAMVTALKAASIWALKGIFISYISSIATLNHVKIRVTPNFSSSGTSSSLICIFKIRLVHIMIIITHILCFKIRRYFQWKHSGRKVPNILLKG